MNLLGSARLRVEAIEVAAVLVDNLTSIGAGELDVVVRIVGHLLRLPVSGVVDKEVHRLVAVGDEVDVLANPHRADVLRHVVGQVLHLLGRGVVQPDVVGHAAAIILPVAELAEDAVVRHALAIRRVAAKSTLGQGQGLGHAAADGGHPKSPLKAVADAVAIDHSLAVRRPGHHDVVRTHAVAHVVARVGRRVGQSPGFATLGGDDVDFAVAIVFAGESNGLAVGRETRKDFITHV